MQTVFLDGETMTTADAFAVARGLATVEIAADAIPKIEAAQRVVEEIISSGETVYGINTGFGALVNQRIGTEDLATLQLNLIRSHACGLGEPLDIQTARGMMLVRANTLAKGHSGSRIRVIQQLVDYLNYGITPFVPRIGSLGASGDLAPLSHMALCLIGEGKCYDADGVLMPTKQALNAVGLIPIELKAKEGLSLINGTSLMVAWLIEAERKLTSLLKLGDLILATSIEARSCSLKPFDSRVHAARGHPGQALVGIRINMALKDSEIMLTHEDCERVQDAYSFRCAPQVHGPVHEMLSRLRRVISVDLNAATDNPLIFPDPTKTGSEMVISQGNFHGQPIALVADSMALACHELASISERRIDQMLDANRSGLPPFLAKVSGLESGLMIVQYVAAASLAELRLFANPASAYNVSTSANQEDHVSLGATAAWSLCKVVERLAEVLACELLVAAEALEYQQVKAGKWVSELVLLTRKISPPLSGDRSVSDELMELTNCLSNGIWLNQLEAQLGQLPTLE
jgi:histidine ammonia-lyase